jgi:hypothetical protein
MIARVIAWGLALAALLAGAYALVSHIEQRGYDRATAEHTAAIHQLQADAANTLADQVSKTRAAEQALTTAKNNQEIQDAKHTQTIKAYAARLRAAAGPAGRLRDPNAPAPECRGSGDRPPGDPATATAAGATDSAETGGLLSEPLTGLLQRLAREADDINAAYASCRADAYTVRQAQ